MYPRNAASPERIAIGPVVQISDGAVQTSGVSVKVLPQGGTASASGGTVAYEEGIVHYLPTQAETNYASFVLIAYKTGCIPATTTVVTSASATTGYAGLDWAKVSAPTTTLNLSGTTISTAQKVDLETIKTQAVTAAAGVTFPTSVASPTNITAGTITTVTTLTNPVTLANGAHGGAAASLALGAGATISSTDGHALTLTGGTNGHGLLASGAGAGSGLVGSGGSGGGHGLYVVGDAAGMGIYAVGGDGSVSAGMALTSNASLSKYGLLVEDGVVFTNDAGVGFLVSSSGTDQHGMVIVGNGTGGDLVADITGNISGSVGSVTGDTKQTADVATLITTVGVAGAGLTALATQASVNTIDDFLDTEIAAILADTNELQTDWTNGGRLDLILDIIAADTTTDIPALIADVPTVAEFEARTLPSADYVVVGDTLAAVTTVGSVTNVVSANVTQWLGSAAATPTVAGVPEVDITHVSGAVTTATLDSLSSQISAIGSGTGAALNFAASDDNADGTVSGVTLAQVGTPTGTFSNTSADDASNHVIASADVAGTQTITWAYGFNCGVARSASKVTWKGTLSGTGPAPDTFTFAAWNGSTWDTRLVVANSVATAQTFDIPLLSTHTTTTGLVILRITFAEADAGTLTTNLLLVQAQQSGSLVGYSDGAIWINTAASNTNTVPYIDGVADNPVSTIAAALTLATSLNLKRLRISNGSSITLGAAVESYSLVGKNWSLALGGQSISGSYIEGATITGTATGASPPEFVECHFVGSSVAPTVPPCTLLRCGINTTQTYPLTAGSAGQFLIVDSFSEVTGSGTPYFTFAGANGVNIRRWSGGTNITLNNTGTTLSIEVVTGGGQTVAVGGADVEIRGICRSVSLTGVTTDSKVQIDAMTGPISIAGADGEVNIYGVCGVVTDSRTGTPTGTNSAISRVNINAEVDTAVLDGVNITRVNNLLIDGAGTELDPWGPAPT